MTGEGAGPTTEREIPVFGVSWGVAVGTYKKTGAGGYIPVAPDTLWWATLGSNQ